MKREDLLKNKMSFDEMALLFTYNNEIMMPNRRTVGKFAKQLGYQWGRQMISGKYVSFYFKNN